MFCAPMLSIMTTFPSLKEYQEIVRSHKGTVNTRLTTTLIPKSISVINSGIATSGASGRVASCNCFFIFFDMYS